VARAAPTLAKLTRPRLHEVLHRKRLFALLDQALDRRRAMCVVGPPGAGKTTLVATWLESARIPGIWYQVDAGDRDLASFFYYLGRAALPFSRRSERPLPALTPEYLLDLPGYSRRFFRDLFARLPEGATLVLDNYQEVPADSPFHGLIAQAVEEVPRGMTLIVISRRDPPDCYARLLAHKDAALLDWDALKLTEDEALEILAGTQLPEDLARRLHAHSGGWAAGLTLLAEQAQRAERVEELDSPERLQDVFDYFAGQIFAEAQPYDQRLLMKLAQAPRMSPALAVALSGNADAARLLEQLYQRHLFTDRRATDGPSGVIRGKARGHVYQFHALFRAFLLHRAQQSLPVNELREALRVCAGQLVDEHQVEDAVGLYTEIGDHQAIAALICATGPELMATGRWQTLRTWLSSLPQDMIENDGEMLLWRGSALGITDHRAGLRDLAHAEHVLRLTGNAKARLRAVQAAARTMLANFEGFAALKLWIPMLEECLPLAPAVLSESETLAVQCAVTHALFWIQPDHPMVAPNLSALQDAVFGDGAIDDEALMIGGLLGLYAWTSADIDLSKRLSLRLSRLAEDPRLSLISRHLWHDALGLSLLVSLRIDEARECFRKALAIAESARLQDAVAYDLGLMAISAALRGEWHEAHGYLDRQGALASGQGGAGEATWRHWQLVFACVRGDWREAMTFSMFAEQTAANTDFPYLRPITDVHLAGMYAAAGQLARARTYLYQSRRTLEAWGFTHFDGEILAVDAYLHWREGDREATFVAIRAMFTIASNPGKFGHVQFVAPLFLDLWAACLEAGVEGDRIAGMIRLFRLPPPDPVPACWPWPVRVRTLGRFAVELDGHPLVFQGKAPRKQLSLLCALICTGSEEVSGAQLTDQIWPDQDGDLAAKSLRTAVSRLRDLLGDARVVRVSNTRYSLDRSLVHCDAWAFEAAADAALANPLPATLERAMALYSGALLPADIDAPWAVQPRERLRGKFNALVLAIARSQERDGDCEAALATYRSGIARDDLAENLYQGEIRCLLALRRNSEAQSTLYRLRRVLAVRLRSSPSAATLALFDSPVRASAS